MSKLEKYTISSDESIRNAIEKMDIEGVHFLVVIDATNKVIGVFTSGDFRKAVLDGLDISQAVSKIANTNYMHLSDEYSKDDVCKLFEIEMVNDLPVLKNGELVEIVHKNEFYGLDAKLTINDVSKLCVVIMAGGKGTRLDPFTRILPKPLIPLGNDPVIKVIMDEFGKFGITNFHLTLNDKSRMIKAYFHDHTIGYQISFVDEVKPLGTAGSLKLLENNITETFFVSNCDIIIKNNYDDLLKFHRDGDYSLTLVGSMRKYTIPYGVCDLKKDGDLKNIREKPEYDFLVNTGLYLLEPSVLKIIPEDVYFDMTDLITEVQQKGFKVGVFPVSQDSWIDIGQWSEYKNTIRQLEI